MLFQTPKWIHILLAILNRDSLPFTLRTIKLIDGRMANPAYWFLLITGFAMVLLSDLNFELRWISLSIILWLGLLIIGIFGYSPTLRKQIKLAESVGPDDSDYKAAAGRGMWLGILLAVIVLLITYLMVFKPI